MLAMSCVLTIVAILVRPVPFYTTSWFRNKLRVAFLDVRDQIARVNSFVQEHISGIAIVQLFNREETEQKKFEKINRDHRSAHLKTIFYFSIFWPFVEVLARDRKSTRLNSSHV